MIRQFAKGCLVIAGAIAGVCLEGIALSQVEPAGEGIPKVTYSNPYFKGTKEEKDAQIKRMTSLFGVECDFCHNEDLTVFTDEGKKSKEMMRASVALGVECDASSMIPLKEMSGLLRQTKAIHDLVRSWGIA